MKSWIVPTLAAFSLGLALLPLAFFIGDDGAYYARVGASIVAGQGISANPGEPYLIHPPFYPLLIGLFNLLFKNLEFSAHWVSILAFALTAIPLVRLAEEIYSKDTARWTGLLYATNGFLLASSNLVMADTLFTFLIVTQLYLVHRIIQEENEDRRNGFLVGMVSGLAFLARPEGFVIYLVSVFALLFLSPKSPALRFRPFLFSLLAFLVFFLPYIRFVYQQSHRFQLSQGITEILIKREMDITSPDPEKYFEIKKIREGLTEDKTRFEMDELVKNFSLPKLLAKDRFRLLRSVPGSAVWRFLELNRYLFTGFGLFLIGASWFGAPWNGRRKKSELLLLLFLSTFSLKLLSQFLPRYFYHYFPIFLLWMGNGIETFRNWGRASFRWSPQLSKGWALGICLMLVLPSGWYLRRVLIEYPMPFEYKELGRWMKQNLPGMESEGVLSRQPAVSFYSGARILKLPYVDRIEDLRAYMGHQHAHYFVVSDDLDRPFLDAYRFLLDETRPAPQGLARIHTVKGARKLILYRVAG